jgi:hypothetical protein
MMSDLLRRHAVARLEALTIDSRAHGELRAYATLLLDEVEYRYETSLEGGLGEPGLRAELAANLQCARQIYSQRSDAEGPAASAIFDAQLSRLIDARRDTALGRDLASVAWPEAADRTDPASDPVGQDDATGSGRHGRKVA